MCPSGHRTGSCRRSGTPGDPRERPAEIDTRLDTGTVKEIRMRLQRLGDKQRAKFLRGFFKTGPGGYAEGDRFLGIRVPELRKLANEYKALTIHEALSLLKSLIHEERLFALLMLIKAFSRGDASAQKEVYEVYLDNRQHVNNWDLVDISAPHIVGAFLIDRSKETLYRLAKSKSLWERRIAVIATFYFIKCHHFSETLEIAEMLLLDKEDLIHKATGWMLREIGKRDLACEESFLKAHCRKMPRIMLRYAIERFPQSKRQMYLDGTIVFAGCFPGDVTSRIG
jgi:3-methyladenine DNA glycosylase AlkD